MKTYEKFSKILFLLFLKIKANRAIVLKSLKITGKQKSSFATAPSLVLVLRFYALTS